jgi:hypothetical protein
VNYAVFVPSVDESRQAEEAYQSIRDQIATFIGPLTDKRIYRLKYDNNGHPQSAVVGSDRHTFGNRPVLAIFEGADGVYYVCTRRNGLYDAEPHPVHTSAVIDAEGFTAFA